LLELGAARVVNPDPCWCGGFTESKKIADLADTYYRPLAPHNCGGPVLHRVCGHLAATIPNFFIQETVRTYYEREHPPIVTNVEVPHAGMLAIPQGAGLGTELREEFLGLPDVVREATT
jgi:L-alanine-DL-glutamate epimerase-like enolase superfamily enzyme